MTFVQYHYLLHYLHSVALVSGHFSSLFLDLYSSFDSVHSFYYLLFSKHWVDLFFFFCVRFAEENVFGTLCLALLLGTKISSW